MNESKEVLIKVRISRHNWELLSKHSEENKIPFGRVVSTLIDNAIENNIPFDYNYSIPENWLDLADDYMDEGIKLFEYLKQNPKGMGLDQMIHRRHLMGIKDIKKLVVVFKQILDCESIEPIPPRSVFGNKPVHPVGYSYYRVKSHDHSTKRKRKNRANKYQTYLKLKKEFESEA